MLKDKSVEQEQESRDDEDEGRTALVYAMSFGQLIDYGIVAAGDEKESTNYDKILRLVIDELIPNGDDSLMIEGMQDLIEAGTISVDTRIGRGVDAHSSLLHYSARYNHAAQAKMLLAHSASTSLLDAQGRTPLDVAIMYGHSKVADLFPSACVGWHDNNTRPKFSGAFSRRGKIDRAFRAWKWRDDADIDGCVSETVRLLKGAKGFGLRIDGTCTVLQVPEGMTEDTKAALMGARVETVNGTR